MLYKRFDIDCGAGALKAGVSGAREVKETEASLPVIPCELAVSRSSYSGSSLSRRAEVGGMLHFLSHPLVLAVLAAMLSIGIQGFEFGINNNVFHIPLVLGFDGLPQFADDPVIRSLRRFVSPVYFFLVAVADEHNVAAIFFLCHFVTRVLTFFALILLLRILGAGSRRLFAAAAVLAVTRGIYGATFLGGGGMLMKYFTHSEVSTAFALLCIGALLRGRLVLAGGLGGMTFALNAFIGVWVCAPLGLAALAHLSASPTGGPTCDALAARTRRIMLAGFTFAVLALPVAVWAMVEAGTGDPGFDYRSFLRLYYGKHFFLDASDSWSILQCVSTSASAVLALPLVAHRRRAALVMTGLLLVLSGGMLVGAFSESRLLLNLHLLRVDALVTMLAAVIVTAGVMRRLDVADPPRTLLLLLALAGVATAFWMVTAAALGSVALLLWLARRRGRCGDVGPMHALLRFAASRPRALTAAALLLLVAYASAGAYLARPRPATTGTTPGDAQLEGFWPASPEWLEVQLWARANTPQDARFLVPLSPGGFRVGAQRVIWVDWKEGATAMWAPETYAAWRRRVDEVLRLRNPEDRLAYACANGLGFVVFDLRGTSLPLAEASPPNFVNRFFAVRRATECS